MFSTALIALATVHAAEPIATAGPHVDAVDEASRPAALGPRKARVGVQLIGIPAGLGLRAHVPVGGSVELTAGASGAVGWFQSAGNDDVDDETSAPYRARVDLGIDKVIVEAETRRLFVGVQAAAAYWTRMPTVGGNNIGVGPRIGIEQGLNAVDVILSGGVLAHQYQPGNYAGLEDGDSAQVLPQVDLEVLF